MTPSESGPTVAHHAAAPEALHQAATPRRRPLRQRLADAYYGAEGIAHEAYAVATGIWGVLMSGLVVRTGGLKIKVALLNGILRYGFTAARQVYYSAEAAPKRTAIIDDMGEVTYAQMREDVMALARYLVHRGFGARANIAVMCRNSRVPIYVLGAKGFAGANIFMFNVASSPRQLLASIEEFDIDILVIDEEFAGHLPADFSDCAVLLGHAEDLHRPVAPNPSWQTFQQAIETAPCEREVELPWHPHQGCITIMSSGTSGTPKGVVHREPVLPTPIADIISRVPWRAEIMVQQSASIFHSWGWACINIVLAHRATVVLRRVFDPEQAVEDMDRYKPTGILTSPIFIKDQLRVMQERGVHAPQVEFICSAGNAIHEDLVRNLVAEFGPIVSNLYGSTENSVCTIATGEELAKDPSSAGRPVRCVRLRILDDHGKPVKQGDIGRIHCTGSMSMRRYANARDRDKMVTRRGLLEIGDRGYLDADGFLHVMGRTDDMIIVGGENVFPRSVENVLAPMPGIRDLYVKGVEDEETFARLAVWVVREDSEAGRALTKEQIQDEVRLTLAEHSVPRDVIWMDHLPRNPTGKVMPRMLPLP